MQCKLKLVECSTVGEYQALLTIIRVLYNKCLGQTLIEITGTWGTYCSTAYCTHMLCCANGYVCHLHCKWLRLDIEDTSQRHASKQTILWGLSHHGPKRSLGNATISWPVVLCCAVVCCACWPSLALPFSRCCHSSASLRRRSVDWVTEHHLTWSLISPIRLFLCRFSTPFSQVAFLETRSAAQSGNKYIKSMN